MKLTNLKVDGFGVWSGLELNELSDRVTVVFGANEAGKTTLMQFIRTVFFGLSATQRQRYLPPVHGTLAGGSIDMESRLGPLTFSRRFLPITPQADSDQSHSSPNDADRFVVLGPDGAELSNDRWRQLLVDVDEQTFHNVFAVGLRELQELGTLQDTDAAQVLYELTTGLDRVSLFDVMRELNGARMRLLNPQGQTGKIEALLTRRRQLQQQLDEVASSGQLWVDLQGQTNSLEGEIEQLRELQIDLQRDLSISEVAVRAADIWADRREINRQLSVLPPAPDISANVLQRLDKLRRGRTERQQRIDELKQRRRLVRQQAASQPINRALSAQAFRIEALAEHGPWITTLESQIDRLQIDIRSLESQLTVTSGNPASGSQGVDDDDSLVEVPDVSRRSLAALREPARALRDERQRRIRAEEELEAAREQLEKLSVELETDLLQQGYDQLSDAVDEVGARVGQFRRRAQLDDHLERMAGRKEQLEREHQQLLEGQVLSLTALVWLGVPFVVGVVLILSGLIWPEALSLGWPVAILGVVGWVIAIVAKIALERSAANDLVRCEKQIALLREQIQEVELELEDVEEHLPHTRGPVDKQLAAAEDELARLEDLLPMEAGVQAARQRVATAERRKERLASSSQELQSRWESSLRRAGLPGNLSLQAAKQLAAENRESEKLRRQLQIRREELAARQRELTTLTLQLEQTVQQAKLPDAGNDPQIQLRRLVAALADQQLLFKRRKQLRREDREIRREGQRLTSQVRRLGQRIEKMVANAGVTSEAELRRIIARNVERIELQARLAECDSKFQAISNGRCGWEDVEHHLENGSVTDLQAQREEMTRRLDLAESDLAVAHQRHGQVTQEAKALQADRRGCQAKMSLRCVEHELGEAVRQWYVLAITTYILGTVREIYETERQPQTLCDASGYFKQLTDGKYLRIWTPLGENALRVDTADGKTLPLELLSCGTREAMFLSLRLALIMDFSRRGVVLPLILDDVLVNFDKQRAGAAAKVLNRFARNGHQVILFTCHEHIMELFSADSVEIRYLPDYDAPSGLTIVRPIEIERTRTVAEQPVVEATQDVLSPNSEYELAEIDEIEPDEEEIEEVDADWELVSADEEDVEADDEYEDDELDEEEIEEADELEDEYDEIEEADELEDEDEYEDVEEEYEEAEEDEDVGELVEETLESTDQEDVLEEDAEDDELDDSTSDRRTSQYFAWESPERWWTDGSGGSSEAAA